MIRISAYLTVVSIAVMGCADKTGTEPASVSPELRALGASKLEIVERDAELVIQAQDDDGTQIASVELSVGRFVMQEEDDHPEVDGRRMSVSVLGQTTYHESRGMYDLTLPAPRNPTIAAFLGDPSVSATLARWGIEIQPRAVAVAPAGGDDAGYDANCGSQFYSVAYEYSPANSGFRTPDHTSNCTGDSGEFTNGSDDGEYRCCPHTDKFAERTCQPFCTSGCSGSTQCGGVGSAGCATCWTETIMGPANFCDISAGPSSNTKLAYCFYNG